MKDDKLYQTLELYNEAMVEAYKPLEQEKEHQFSRKFERKMSSLIRRQKKPYYFAISTPRRRVAIVAALIAILMLTACSIPPVRDFVVKVYREFSTIIFNTDADNIDDVFEKAYIEIPDGYTAKELSSEPYFVEMKNGVSNIRFEQVQLANTQVDIDTEGTTHENIVINGLNGVYYYNKGRDVFVWTDNRYCYILSGDIGKEELLKIAETVK